MGKPSVLLRPDSAVIRTLASEDMEQVMELERLGHSHPWSEGIFRDCFKDGYRLWALEQDHRVLGFAVVNYLFDEAHLLNICVHPQLRGQGAGRQLLQHALAESVKDGMVCMILEVRDSNRAAIELYAGEGFREIGRRRGYYPDGPGREDARVMALRFT